MPDLIPELEQALVRLALGGAAAIVILLVGRWLAGLTKRWVGAALRRTKATPAMTDVIERAAFYGILLLALFLALVALGIPADVLITAIAVVLVIAAVALRESLRDLAATVIFVIFQPFSVGDLIETNGMVGYVQEILMFNTVLITQDNRTLIAPNGNIQNNNLINYSTLDKIRLDLTVRSSYTNDLPTAKATLLEIAHADARVMTEPAPLVDVMGLNDDGIQLVLRVYSTPDDYWALRPALNEQVKLEFDRRGLAIPLPQLDLHLTQMPNSDKDGTAPTANVAYPKRH